MPGSLDKIAGTLALGLVFYFTSTHESFAYLDPGAGSMILTSILGIVAATIYTLKGYMHRIARVFRRDHRDDARPSAQERD
ncbi:hypothetical protein I3J27_04710 [Bradyrhizobium xenonodulans]|uniref:Uncharacterized protein n=1 Tax=Bradyrhizobium xenonodulans TaxID=2736875 RepID=A0ABY7MMX3_9BRAD|nr:hypothetical protein [Bradyrhizobium xenonodulans]WBL79738.1 hypothetical protein I3J27_04710 [Bradyrhizobium xenonodulans]